MCNVHWFTWNIAIFICWQTKKFLNLDLLYIPYFIHIQHWRHTYSSLTIIFLGVNEDDDDWFDLCMSPIMIIFTLVYLQYFLCCFFCNQSNNRVQYFSEKNFLRRGNHVQKESSSTKDLQKASIFYIVIESLSSPTFHTFENSNRQVYIVLVFPRSYKKLASSPCLVEYEVWLFEYICMHYEVLIFIVSDISSIGLLDLLKSR